MRILNEVGTAWRNYLYANEDGKHNDAQDFLTRAELIEDMKTELLKVILSPIPDIALLKKYKEEMEFQKKELFELAEEFCSYYYNHCSKAVAITITPNEILSTLYDEQSYFVEIVRDWEEWGENIEKVWNTLEQKHGCHVRMLRDDLCRLMLEQVYRADAPNEISR